MLLRNRAAVALGLRLCSTHVTKGPVVEASSGKSKVFRFLFDVSMFSSVLLSSNWLIFCGRPVTIEVFADHQNCISNFVVVVVCVFVLSVSISREVANDVSTLIRAKFTGKH